MLRHIFILVVGAGLFPACKKSQVKPAESKPIAWLEDLSKKQDTYIELTKEVRDDYGFVRNCDSLLFTSLGNIGGTRYDLSIAEGIDGAGQPTGLWFRTPAHDCYPEHSRSDISKDMLRGLIWSSVRESQVSRLSRLFEYGRDHGWIMGRGDVGATLLTPALVADLAEAIFRLGGTNHKEERLYPQVWPEGLRGYESHLQVLGILFRGELTGSITEEMRDRLKEHYTRNPGNALLSYAYHHYTDGDYSESAKLLLDEKMFPADRLPKGSDRCQSYLFQREQTEFVPCDEGHELYDVTFDGSDFIFVSGLIRQALSNGG